MRQHGHERSRTGAPFSSAVLRAVQPVYRGILLSRAAAADGTGWPGNIRPLRSIVERLALFTEARLITAENVAADAMNIDRANLYRKMKKLGIPAPRLS
ncbi:hypothetical protein GX408_01510 [bacterium]|nr:hypothetical protein [bacterium]